MDEDDFILGSVPELKEADVENREDLEEDEMEEEQEKKTRRKPFKYQVIAAFNTAQELLKFLGEFDKKQFYRERTRNQKKHMVEIYYCKQYRRGCKYALVVRLNNDDESSIMEERIVEHNHDNTKAKALTDEIKDFITVNINKPASIIMKMLEKEKPNVLKPSKKQIENFLNRERKKNGTRGELTEYTLERKAARHLRNDNEPDSPFALYTGLAEYEVKGKFDWVLSFTTPNLMKKQHAQKNVQIDAKYRMTWNKFPIVLAGFSDAALRFHPTIWAVVSRECEQTYIQIFQEMKQFNPEQDYIPDIVMEDGHGGITSASKNVFGNSTIRMMCYFHLMQNVKNKISNFKINKALSEKIKKDIEQLRGAANAEEFKKAATLMLDQWKNARVADDFVNYFKNEYINGELNNWFSGLSDYVTTNNAVEGKNNSLKNHVTERNLWTVMELMPKMLEETNDFWTSYQDVATKLPVTHQEYIDGFKFKNLKKSNK